MPHAAHLVSPPCHSTQALYPGLVPFLEFPLLSLKPLMTRALGATSPFTLVPPWFPRMCPGECRWHLCSPRVWQDRRWGKMLTVSQSSVTQAEESVGSWRVPPPGCVTSLALPSVDWCPVFLLSSPDVPQLPTPHVHSTPAPPPGPSQPISHASMASAPSFTPALIQGTVSSFSLSLWPSLAQEAPQEDGGPALAWGQPCQVPSPAPVPWCVWILVFSSRSPGWVVAAAPRAVPCPVCPCHMLSLCPAASPVSPPPCPFQTWLCPHPELMGTVGGFVNTGFQHGSRTGCG